MEIETVNRTANTILDNSENFKVKFMGMNLKFGIRPLRLGTLIFITKASAQMGDVIVPENIVSVIGMAEKTARPMSRVIAYSILNNRTGIKLFGGMLANFLLWRLTPSELLILIQLVIKQSSVTDFFSCTVLTKGISPIKTVDPLKVAGLSGEKSPAQ